MVPARLAKAHRSVKPVGSRGQSRGADADGGRRGGEEPGCLGDGLLQPAGHRPRHDNGAVGEPVGVARRVGQVDGHRHGDVIGGTRSEIDVGSNTGRVQPFGSLRSDSFDPRQVVRPVTLGCPDTVTSSCPPTGAALSGRIDHPQASPAALNAHPWCA
jgi:hypothetical protein